MSGREIITIQMGHYANFVGAHWWNLQEANFSYDSANPGELNNDILFREGENCRREITFTPRSLIVDLKGSLGYLSEYGSLYNDEYQYETNPSNLWYPENFEITTEGSSSKTPFVKKMEEKAISSGKELYDFENDVDSWVDFLASKFHPRTINVIKEYKHKCSSSPFDVFHYGKNLWRTEQFQEDFSDKIRAYAEECDWMQGFQILLNSYDAFGGLGVSCMEYLHDEYGRSILAFPLIESQKCNSSTSETLQTLNTGLCYQQLGDYASLFIPLCCTEDPWRRPGIARKFPNLIYDHELKYHTSAILACALETVSIRYRHKERTMSSLSDLCADMNKLGRKAAAMSLNFPFPMTVEKDLIDILDDINGKRLWTSLTPSVEISGDKSLQSIALRGIPEERLKRPIAEAKSQINKTTYSCSSVHEMMSMYLAYSCHASATYVTNINAGLNLPVPFPNFFFPNNIYKSGEIASGHIGENVKNVAVLAGVHSTPEMSGLFDSLHNKMLIMKSANKMYLLGNWGLEKDEFTECLDHLQDCKENYQDHYI